MAPKQAEGKEINENQKKKEAECAGEIEGPVEAKTDFFQKAGKEIKNKVIMYRHAREGSVFLRPVVAFGKRTDERKMTAEVAPVFAANQNSAGIGVVG